LIWELDSPNQVKNELKNETQYKKQETQQRRRKKLASEFSLLKQATINYHKVFQRN